MAAIKERDRKLLDLLAMYEVLSSRLIRESLFPSTATTNFFRRLRQLEKAKFIKRLGPMEDHSYAWTLDGKGKNLCGVESNDFFSNRATLEHDATVAHVRLLLEKHQIAKSFTPESVLRKDGQYKNQFNLRPENTIIVPDGMFEALIRQKMQTLSLEVELSYKNRRRYHDLFRRYHELHDPVFMVWYLVKTRSMGERIESCWHKFHKANPRHTRQILFMFTEVDPFLKDPSEADYHMAGNIYRLYRIWPHLEKRSDQSADQALDQSGITPMIEKSVGEKCA